MPTPEFVPAFFAASGETGSLAITMLAVFGTAKILEELFERLGQPGIIGQILAGILIGPSVLGWVSPNDFTAALAQMGVMFLLFRVGLEVDSEGLMRTGGSALITGVLGVAVPFACGWAFYRLAGRPPMEAVFLGVALTATSVGITAQVLAARGLLDSTAAKIILGAAVVDDILALLLLGFVTSIAQGEVNALELGVTSVLAVGFVIVVVRWGASTIGRVVAKLEGKLQAGEAEFALAMVLLFALAALSRTIGVAAIIGAFLAGMALAPSTPRRVHDLTSGVTELLVPFFLAEIGLHFDVNVFRKPEILILALLLVPVAVFSKILACSLGASGSGRDVAIRVGVGMIPRGEFCMVVAQAGLVLGVIKPDTYTIIVFMAVIAAALAPPLLKWAFRKVLAETSEGRPS
ncbi:MAG: cation:proton antiporter [Acidobacteriota bacterium]